MSAQTPPHPISDVDIHSHKTGAALIGDEGHSTSASEPSDYDLGNIEKVEMFIIVGKNEKLVPINEEKADGTPFVRLPHDARTESINIYDKNNKVYDKDGKLQPVKTINGDEAEKILNDFEKR